MGPRRGRRSGPGRPPAVDVEADVAALVGRGCPAQQGPELPDGPGQVADGVDDGAHACSHHGLLRCHVGPLRAVGQVRDGDGGR
jgi:hypothetical protein